ncbi:Hemocyte protein-glutamine gamma-glutamyltransferase [Operophtera brumata]|uniref:Hemocyte protein-glutamine gamma-glutamyltransferase n=1 Tax=Operophtera brumata TaxID=104452 RepID=A0A0L7KZY8_OPEBR|nr:Hemocyte protein-glutamine gamma-glutamyltransferase [Operophtera brumata]
MDPLVVDIVYFYPRDNAKIHNTIKYEEVNNEQETTTIVRRGQPFNGVSTPVSLPVGIWSLQVVTRLKNSAAREIWVGPIKTTRGKPWAYGQFDAVVLPACMYMLDRGEMPFQHRGDPVKMARHISRLVNSIDDGGVLIGRWDGQYDDGTAPSEWTGSLTLIFLSSGYGGWQAIDATPQEKSSGLFQCGPAPLEAIKQGVIGLGYDVEFMLASVNADLMSIGRKILTKKPYVFDPNGDGDVEDITPQYFSVAKNLENDVTFKLRDIDTVQIGKEFRVSARNIKASLSAVSVFYNGVRAEPVKKVEGKIFVGPGKVERISILVTASDYLPKLVEYCNMKISAMAIVEETKQSWADDDDFQVLKPNINIKFNEDLILGQSATATLSFANPLEVPLTNCEFRFTSSGIAGRTLRFQADDVAPGQSNELKDINGAASAEVYEG